MRDGVTREGGQEGNRKMSLHHNLPLFSLYTGRASKRASVGGGGWAEKKFHASFFHKAKV